MPRPRRTARRLLQMALTSMVLIAPSAGAEVAREGTFEANWSLEGTREEVEVAGKKMAAYRMTGEVTVHKSDGLSSEFGVSLQRHPISSVDADKERCSPRAADSWQLNRVAAMSGVASRDIRPVQALLTPLLARPSVAHGHRIPAKTVVPEQ